MAFRISMFDVPATKLPFGAEDALDRRTPPPVVSGDPNPKAREGSRGRRLLAAAAVGILGLGALGTVAVERLPWFGPFVGDTLRSLVGVDATIAIEEAAADVDDRLNRLTSNVSTSAPRNTAQALAIPAASAPLRASRRRRVPPFVPSAVSPMYVGVAAPDDGRWIPIRAESERPENAPCMFLTLVHPDAGRRYAELFVVALDVRRVTLHAVPGTREPLNVAPGAAAYPRTGLVPEADRRTLIAVFNGGFKTVHGRYGMQVGGVTLVPPRETACTVGVASTGKLSIGTWATHGFSSGHWQFWRQTPACLFENGEMHPGLRVDSTRAWGAALKGDTVIRRSALGVSRDGSTLFVGVGNALTARALAEGMNHAGASDVAQLDINFSYPKFAVFRRSDSGKREARSVLRGFTVRPDDYLRTPNARDFFYVTAN